MPERSYKIALRSADEWKRRTDPAIPRMPLEKLRVDVGVAFGVSLQGVVTRKFDKTVEIRRYAKADREALEAAGEKWEEPSAHLDAMMAAFREELELALRDAMPWDDEL